MILEIFVVKSPFSSLFPHSAFRIPHSVMLRLLPDPIYEEDNYHCVSVSDPPETKRSPTAYLARNSQQAKVNEAAAAYLRTTFRVLRPADSTS